MNEQVSSAAKLLASLGASKGGTARAASLTPERRREIAVAAVRARWAKQRIEATSPEQEPPSQKFHPENCENFPPETQTTLPEVTAEPAKPNDSTDVATFFQSQEKSPICTSL